MTPRTPPKTWTTADIPDLTGRTAAVTGANSGIGLVTARELARAGAHVWLGCRDPRRGRDAHDQLTREVPKGSFELVQLDLADLSSVRDAAERIGRETGGTLDVLVNNAGVMALPLRRTADGFEMQFGTNHLGHFALTGRLLPALRAARAARVVTVSSLAHRIGRIDFGNLSAERRYSKWLAYGQSKLANLLFTHELDRRARAAGWTLTAVAAHPGMSATNLAAAGPRLAGRTRQAELLHRGTRLMTQSAEGGALPTLRAATDPDVTGGDYLGPGGVFETRGAPVWVSTTAAARDRATAHHLWAVSEELTGVTYPGL
ncbi:SDR family oxidoreductase [Streptomyces sp. JJ66]|uniref:oxidoreductase n=1 Tax=Streptomyces sp. JJ66 TaxID=2803843 RepID=UPI001C594511|nr:oxidoreductase [Streptomyces sp. JJ66]MBW1601487.1 SDR family oxidoreductase [Streptomyces sp. JJ66]